MTKAKMIETLQKLEAAKWKDLKEWEYLVGREESITRRARTEWCVVKEALNALDIEPDHQLPDVQKAWEFMDLIMIRERQEDALQAEIAADMAKRD